MGVLARLVRAITSHRRQRIPGSAFSFEVILFKSALARGRVIENKIFCSSYSVLEMVTTWTQESAALSGSDFNMSSSVKERGTRKQNIPQFQQAISNLESGS